MSVAPDSSAVRTALWRALHVQLDDPPHLLEDEIGLALVAPDDDWRKRPDMHPRGTRPFRAAIVARTRFVEDLLFTEGIDQYVLLGAGLDTFAQRHPETPLGVTVFEIDQPGPQAWKRQRLNELGYGVPDRLRLVPVDFEADDDWWQALIDTGFDRTARAVVSSSGVSMYITKAATAATLRRLATLSPGSIVALAHEAGFADVRYASGRVVRPAVNHIAVRAQHHGGIEHARGVVDRGDVERILIRRNIEPLTRRAYESRCAAAAVRRRPR